MKVLEGIKGRSLWTKVNLKAGTVIPYVGQFITQESLRERRRRDYIVGRAGRFIDGDPGNSLVKGEFIGSYANEASFDSDEYYNMRFFPCEDIKDGSGKLVRRPQYPGEERRDVAVLYCLVTTTRVLKGEQLCVPYCWDLPKRALCGYAVKGCYPLQEERWHVCFQDVDILQRDWVPKGSVITGVPKGVFFDRRKSYRGLLAAGRR
jgi:hypothetical protein